MIFAMTDRLYFGIGAIVAYLMFIAGLVFVHKSKMFNEGLSDKFAGVVFTVCMAAMAGLVWPAALLVGMGFLILQGLRYWENRPKKAPKPTERERYLQMARDQRALADHARKLGDLDLAKAQEQLASQYDLMAAGFTMLRDNHG